MKKSRKCKPRPQGVRTPIAVSNNQAAVRVSSAELRRLVEFVARREGCRVAGVDLAIVADEAISGVNRRFLHHDRPTDVLSFDLSQGQPPGLSLEVIVSGDAAVRQGPLHGHSPGEELMIYVIHGLLHQMGYEDATVRGGARMHARQDELLAEFLRRRR